MTKNPQNTLERTLIVHLEKALNALLWYPSKHPYRTLKRSCGLHFRIAGPGATAEGHSRGRSTGPVLGSVWVLLKEPLTLTRLGFKGSRLKV